VQILEQQLAYTTADLTRVESQRTAARELVLDLTERLRASRTNSSELARELEGQLASATAEVARLERRLAIFQELVGELTERLRAARAAAGL
jgi:chromosome segregation ATPase